MIDIQSVRLAHRRFLAAHDAAVSSEMKRSAETGVVHVHKHPGFTPRTGGTQRATTGKVIRTSRGGIVRLQNPKAHARTLEGGSRAHPIPLRSGGKMLRFTSSDGTLMFRRSVNHPGTKPYRFLSSAVAAAGKTFALGMAARQRQIASKF